MSHYSEFFRASIRHLLEQSVTQVQGGSELLSAAIRDQALHILTFALKLDNSWSMTRTLLLGLAPAMEKLGHRADWLPYLEAGLQQSEQFGDLGAEPYLRLQLGMLYQFLASYEQANEHLTRSAAGFAYLGQHQQQAEALNRLAYIARLRRQHAVARSLVDEALTLLAEDAPGRSFSCFVLGWIANDAEKYEEAVEHFQTALSIAKRTGNQRLCALYLGNLGTALRKVGELDKAISCYTDSIHYFGEIQDRVQQAVMQMNLGNIYLIQQQPDKALESYVLAEPILLAVKDEMHLALLIMNKGIALRESGQLTAAEQSLLTVIDQWHRLGNRYCLVNTWDELGLVYLAQGCYTQATNAFLQGFEQLTHMIDQPGYSSLFASLTQHFQQLAAVAPAVDRTCNSRGGWLGECISGGLPPTIG